MLKKSSDLQHMDLPRNGSYMGSARLISVEDVRNYLSHIIYILIFDFFFNFLLFVRLQIPTSSTDQLWLFVT